MAIRGEIAWDSFKVQVSGSKFPDNLKHETSNFKLQTGDRPRNWILREVRKWTRIHFWL